MLEATLNKTAAIQPTASHLTVYSRELTGHAGHFWEKGKFFSQDWFWTHALERAYVGKIAKSYISSV